MDETLKLIDDQKIIGIVRAGEYGDAEAIAKALIDGGIRILEITPAVPQFIKLIESLSKQDTIVPGFGSATDGEQAYRAISAGARFVSSHYTDKNIFTLCKNHNAAVIQGAATVNEIMEAYTLGVDLIKIYPANFLGEVPYVKRLKRSFPFLKLVPAGGVHLENVLDYLKAGAAACVIGSGLCDKAWVRVHQWNEITERAKQFVQKIESLKVPR